VDEHLIRPADGWTYWDPIAEEMHGISREYLLTVGVPVEVVTKRAVAALERAIILSDASRLDGFWFRRMLAAADIQASVNIQSSEWLSNAIAERRFDDDEGGSMVQAGRQDDWITEIKAKAYELAPPSHRVADDVRNLMTIYKLAMEGMSEPDVAALYYSCVVRNP
jgi:hypothetical protein